MASMQALRGKIFLRVGHVQTAGYLKQILRWLKSKVERSGKNKTLPLIYKEITKMNNQIPYIPARYYFKILDILESRNITTEEILSEINIDLKKY
jgi:hypothetical protein